MPLLKIKEGLIERGTLNYNIALDFIKKSVNTFFKKVQKIIDEHTK